MLNRGMASRHVAILWEGFNIQSVVNGTYDLGLIQNTFDRVNVYQSGRSTSTGNASMAGAISLTSGLNGNQTIIRANHASINNQGLTFINKLKKGNYLHNFAANRTTNKNEYSFKNGGNTIKQTSAKFSVWSLNYKGSYSFSQDFGVSGGIWLQDADRNIPPTKTSAAVLQQQRDNNYRAYLRATMAPFDHTTLTIRSAYFDELLEYTAPGVSSLAKTKAFTGAVDVLTMQAVKLSVQYRRDRVDASFFEPLHTRSSTGILADYDYKRFENWNIGLSLRSEWVDGKSQPFSANARIRRSLDDNLEIYFQYNKGYTLPSFNDLYWPNGGNQELKTEKSNELDLGVQYNYSKLYGRSITLNTYINHIDDWIQWSPIQGMFRPINQRKVRNMGLEVRLEEYRSLSDFGTLKFRLMYALTDSRLIAHYTDPSNEGKRTIFVPQHKINGQISWSKKSWSINVFPLYYSKRFDTVDNSSYVPGFFIADFEVNRALTVGKRQILLSISMKNGLNNDYENIRFYPMPLRYFNFETNIKL